MFNEKSKNLQRQIFSLCLPRGKRLICGCFAALLLALCFSLAQAMSPGDLDPTFGTGGKVTTDFGSFENGYDVAIQPDGKIVVVGRAFVSVGGVNTDEIGVARYNLNGMLDASFDGDGKAVTSIGNGNDYAYSVAIQTDGKIVVAGDSSNGSNSDFAVVRYNVDGSLDTSFDGDGKVTTNINNSQDAASEVLIQSDGKIVVVGDTADPVFGLTVVRYNQNGSLDTSFDGDGIATAQYFATPVIFRNASVTSAVLQSDDKIVIGGYVNIPPSFDFAVARLNSNGSPDATFGNDSLNPGWVVTPVRTVALSNDEVNSIALQADGKIIAAGNTYDSAIPSDFAIVRYNSNGALDNSFGTGGIVTTAIGADSDTANSIVVQPNGKIIVAGSSFSSATNADFALARYNQNSSLDNTFGNGSKTTTNFSTTIGQTTINGIDTVNAIALQADGKLVAAGATGIGAPPDFALARYLLDSINTNKPFDFDGDGKADVSVFRPANGAWYLNQSANGFTGVSFGLSTDKIVPADYDGDGKTDVAVYRGGTWYLQRSQAGFTGVAFGDSNDIPVPADYDGDEKADIAVFRVSSGTWYLLQSTAGFTGIQFGQAGDKPVTADYDGDGKADVAVYRSETWFLNRSQLGFTGIQFGESADKVVPADYDGDGKADIAVFRPSNATWYLLRSSAGFSGIAFGLGTDAPVPADYDGDGKTDLAVFRDGTWYLQRSIQGFTGDAFGAASDQPIPNAYVR